MGKGVSSKHLVRICKKEKEKNLAKLRACAQKEKNSVQRVAAFCETNADQSGAPDFEHIEEKEETCENKDIRSELGAWFLEYNVSRQCCSALLHILKRQNLNIPLHPDSLTKNEKAVIRTCTPGQYWHCGIRNQLLKISKMLHEYDEVVVDIGIDGLPLFKSSQTGLWPILGRLVNIDNVDVFIIGAYFGPKKPVQVGTYLHDLSK